jgi:Glycoside hydrolase family 44
MIACGGEPGPVTPSVDGGPTDVTVTVDTTAEQKPISPLIYGVNGDPEDDRPGVTRSGGNRLTAYNWENNASNAGSDYCYQNDGSLGGPGSPPANAFRELLEDAEARDTAVVITAPIVAYVAADHDDNGDGGAGPPSCVGDVRKSGGDYLTTRFEDNVARKGSAFQFPPAGGDGKVYQDEGVAFVAAEWPGAELIVSLDNEPDLWSETHAEIHPAKVTYAELAERSEAFADAIKDAVPGVAILGPASYGFAGYVTLQDAPDAAGRDFLAFYLAHMQDAEGRTGRRLLDYLDLHWYPEAVGDGVRITSVDDARGAAARVQAPRSLWDESYAESSWIVNDYLHEPIALLPRVQAKIDAEYPGTKLAFTEWNYGGGGDISGAMATADVLGVFGREGVGLATIWFLHEDERFTRAGLRAYTNYDGAGGHFGETSVKTTVPSAAELSAFGSLADDGRVVVVLVNKASAAQTVGVRVEGEAVASGRVWRISGTQPQLVGGDAVSVTGGVAALSMPRSSVAVLELR